jgi:hypothetical protein
LPFCDLFFNSNDAQVFDDLWLKGKDAFAFKLCIHESKLNHECQIKVRANRLPAHFVMPMRLMSTKKNNNEAFDIVQNRDRRFDCPEQGK